MALLSLSRHGGIKLCSKSLLQRFGLLQSCKGLNFSNKNLTNICLSSSWNEYRLECLLVRHFVAESHQTVQTVENGNEVADLVQITQNSLSKSLRNAIESKQWDKALRLVSSVPGKACFRPKELDEIPYNDLSIAELEQLAKAYDSILHRSPFEETSVERALGIYLLLKDAEKALRILNIAGASATADMGFEVLQVCVAAESVPTVFECLEKMVKNGTPMETRHIRLSLKLLETKRREDHIMKLLELVDRSDVLMDIQLYNSFMYASFKARRYRDVLDLLRKMKRFQLLPDEYSYSLYLSAFVLRDKFFEAFEQLKSWEHRNVFTLCPTLFIVLGELGSAAFRTDRIVTFHGDIVKGGRKLDLTCSNALATFTSLHGHVYQSFRVWRHRREHSLDFDSETLNAILLGCMKSRRFDLSKVVWQSFDRYNIQRTDTSFSLFIGGILRSLSKEKFVFSVSKDAASEWFTDSNKMSEFLSFCEQYNICLDETEIKSLLLLNHLYGDETVADKILQYSCSSLEEDARHSLEQFDKELDTNGYDVLIAKDLARKIFRKNFAYLVSVFKIHKS
eukprot:jgi/Galph1/5208/GphlegSOOS_G3865.1